MTALLVTALVWIAGATIAAALLHAGWTRGSRCAAFAVALAPAVGSGVASLLYFFALFAGVARPRGLLAGLLAAAVGLAVAFAVRGGRRGADRGPRPLRVRVATPVAAVAWVALAVSVVVGGRMLAHLVVAWPEGTWDAVAIWNVRALFLFHGGSGVPELLAAVSPSSHPHYPLLLPGTIAAVWTLTGGELEWVPRVVTLGFTCGLVALAFAATAESGSRAAGALAAAVVGGTPLVWLWGAAQVADVAVAYLLLGVLVVLASQLDGYPGRPLPPELGGFLLGALAWAKNEGALMALIAGALLALALALEAVLAGRRSWTPILARVAAGAVPGFAALVLFKRFWAPRGTGTDTFLQGAWADRITEPERWWLPVRAIAHRLLELGEPTTWHFLWPGLLVAALAVPILHRARLPCWLLYWATTLAAVVASWLPIYAITPYEQGWHVQSSLDRLLLQVMPAAVCAVVMGLVAALPAPRGLAGLLRSARARRASSGRASRSRSGRGAGIGRPAGPPSP